MNFLQNNDYVFLAEDIFDKFIILFPQQALDLLILQSIISEEHSLHRIFILKRR
jgi:hypothetical protein